MHFNKGLFYFTLLILIISCSKTKKENNREIIDVTKEKSDIYKSIGESMSDGTFKISIDTFKLKKEWEALLVDSLKKGISKISIKEKLLEDREDTTFFYLSAVGDRFSMGKVLFKNDNKFYFYDSDINIGFDEDSEIAFESIITCYSSCKQKCELSLFQVNKTYYWSCQGCEFDCIKSTSIGM